MLDIFQAAIQAVSGERSVARWLAANPQPDCDVLAVGKAADAMLRGALAPLGEGIEQALLITKYGHVGGGLPERVRVIESAHPVPDENSLRAGQAALDFVAAARRPLLVLLSGGASALMEALPAGMGLAELQRASDWLLGSGLAIDAMNRVRKRLSQTKGGGLARAASGRPLTVLAISDVPGDDPAIIGSGPFWPQADRAALPELPDWLAGWCGQPADAGHCPPHHIVASLDLALDAAAAAARKAGLAVQRHDEFLAGDTATRATEVAQKLIDGPSGIHLWGGETGLQLPAEPGRGGRNQHFALCAAQAIAGRDDVLLLAAGTDGTDGPTGDAGALVDGGSIQRIEQAGMDPAEALRRADSGRALELAGDLIRSGPTGTNVMDIVIGVKRG